ncbi:MAG: adenosine-specific kinase [candidate division WOR-3 bacterium]
MELKKVTVELPADANVIIGQSHFIKTVEDLHELLVSSVPQIRFGLAFCEASGPCLVRLSGNDSELEQAAGRNALAIGAGHSFVILIRQAFPINVLNAIKQVQEVCTIFCATANPVSVIVADDGAGRGILGVIDGKKPAGLEGEKEVDERRALLRRFGYKL